MEKIKKYLLRIELNESKKILFVIKKLKKGDGKYLDIKKLKGFPDIFRVRIGEHRIIYRKQQENINILFIGHRNEKTYKKF